ncbi:MAG: hypothetical protein FJ267_13880 [Planctomycetes bacterium]|nr:hypothetical protein [Planctomycetota bacterium]
MVPDVDVDRELVTVCESVVLVDESVDDSIQLFVKLSDGDGSTRSDADKGWLALNENDANDENVGEANNDVEKLAF